MSTLRAAHRLLPLVLCACAKFEMLDLTPKLTPIFRERRNEHLHEAVAVGVSGRSEIRDTLIRLVREIHAQHFRLTFMLRPGTCWSALSEPQSIQLWDDVTGQPTEDSLYLRVPEELVSDSSFTFLAPDTDENRERLGIDPRQKVRTCIAASLSNVTRDSALRFAQSLGYPVSTDADTRANARIQNSQRQALGRDRMDWLVYVSTIPSVDVVSPKSEDGDLRRKYRTQARQFLRALDANFDAPRRLSLDVFCIPSGKRPCFAPGRSYRLVLAPAGSREPDPAEIPFRVLRTSRSYAFTIGTALTALFLILQTS